MVDERKWPFQHREQRSEREGKVSDDCSASALSVRHGNTYEPEKWKDAQLQM